MKIAFYIYLLIYSTLSLAAENSITSLAETLKQRDKEYQIAEQEREATKERILTAKAKFEAEYIKSAFEIFRELKQQGVHFKTDLLYFIKDSDLCHQIQEKYSDKEFIVIRSEGFDICHSVIASFWPEGTERVSLYSNFQNSEVIIDDLKFDNDCILELYSDDHKPNFYTVDHKSYTCPDIMKPETSLIINKDVREMLTKQLSQ